MTARRLIPALVILFALVPPTLVHAQADWTIDVPLQVQSLPADFEAGVVVCVVSPDPGTASNAETISSGLPHQLESTLVAYPVSPGEAFPEFDGVDHNDGRYVGYQTFTPDSRGNGPSSVTVEVMAHPDANTGQKVAVQAYACALGLRPAGTAAWLNTHPDSNQSDWWQIMTPADPSSVVSGVGGLFGN